MWISTIFFLVCILYFSTFSNLSYAGEIHYSIGPTCSNSNVICKNPNEIPTCLSLNPRIHIETIKDANGNDVNRFQPSCGEDSLSPTCIDVAQNIPAKGITLECIEFVKCQISENKNELIPQCSGGKVPQCLGSDKEPACGDSTICGNNAIPICDYIWQASAY